MSKSGENGERYVSREGGKSCQEQLQEQYDASKFSNKIAHEESLQLVHDLRRRLQLESKDHDRTKATVKYQEAARTQFERIRGEVEDDLAASEAEVENLRRLLLKGTPKRGPTEMDALLKKYIQRRHEIALRKARTAAAKPL